MGTCSKYQILTSFNNTDFLYNSNTNYTNAFAVVKVLKYLFTKVFHSLAYETAL